jgi:protein-S-isoprenylcysteine O-methyltransferase Ste14
MRHDDLIHNERIKYLATWLNAIASAVVVIGVVAPIAAVFYGATGSPSPGILALGGALWLLAGLGLHLGVRRILKRIRS